MVTELRTARDLGKPLNLLRFGRKKWRWEDRAMAIALTLYEDSLCGRCGHPRDRAFNPDMEGWYSTVTHTCQACAALERDQADRKLEPGQKMGVSDDGWGEGFTPDPRWLTGAVRPEQASGKQDGADEGHNCP